MGLMSLNLITAEFRLFPSIEHGDPGQRENFMGREHAEIVVDKHDDPVAIERFDLSPIHVPGSLFACLVESAVLLLPREEMGW